MAGVSSLGQYLDQISRLKTQQLTMTDLTTQLSSNKKSQNLSGLGNDIIKTSRARTGVNSLNQYVENIKNADRRIKLMLTSINEIKAQAEKIADGLVTAVQEGDYPDLESIKQMTKNVYNFVLDAMNQTDGDRYLFGGGDTSQQPINDTGLLNSFLGEFVPDEADLTNPPLVASGVIGDWGDGTITTEQFISSYRNVNEAVLGYSNAITTNTAGKTNVRVNDVSDFDYTTLANNPGMKQLVIAMGVLNTMPPVEYAPGALNDPAATTLAEDVAPFPPAAKQESFFAVMNDLTAMINDALDSMDQEVFKLSQVQAQITIVKNSHTEQINAYKNIIGEVEDIDQTEVAVKINQMQVQMEASFQVTALLSQLSLVNFIGN